MADKKDWPTIGMTLDETAAALRVDRRTVQKAIMEQGLPARKVGVGWRIDPDAVKGWLASGKGACTGDSSDEE